MQQVANEDPRVGTRSADRLRFDIFVEARSQQTRLRVEVLDCSATGVRLRTLSPLRLGSTFWLRLPGLEAKEIEVVWVDCLLAGCAFKEAIDERVFKTMLANAKGAAPRRIVDRRSVPRAV
jgi:hypothetical protein